MPIHHKIARSRGGTDDAWNLADLTDEEHTYEHALDFVLFPDFAPCFDCRLPGWKTLPPELKEVVRAELGRRMSAKYSDPQFREAFNESQKNPERRRKSSETQKGRVRREDEKAAMRKPKSKTELMGRYERTPEVLDRYRKATLSQPRRACPHCGTVCAPGMLKRWHGENCRRKP